MSEEHNPLMGLAMMGLGPQTSIGRYYANLIEQARQFQLVVSDLSTLFSGVPFQQFMEACKVLCTHYPYPALETLHDVYGSIALQNELRSLIEEIAKKRGAI